LRKVRSIKCSDRIKWIQWFRLKYDKLCHIRWVRRYQLSFINAVASIRVGDGIFCVRNATAIYSTRFKVTIFAISPKISAASRDIRPIPSLSSIFSFFSPSGWNVNRGRDILQRGHEVRAWNQFKSCSSRRDRKAGIVPKFNLHAPCAQIYSFPRPPWIRFLFRILICY